MKYRFTVLAWCKNPYSSYLMDTVYGEQHWLWWHRIRMARSNHYLPVADATDQDYVACSDIVLFGKTLDAFWDDIAIFESNNENAPYFTLT
jgi:hypothetical protein